MASKNKQINIVQLQSKIIHDFKILQKKVNIFNYNPKSFHTKNSMIEENETNSHPFKIQTVELTEILLAETKQWLLNWFSLTRQEKRKFDWQSKSIVLYPMLIPIFFTDVDLSQIVVSHYELNDRFNKFFSSSFRIKNVSWMSEDAYNLNQIFLMTLNQELDVIQELKKNTHTKNLKSKKFCNISGNYLAKPWGKIQHYNNIIKLSSIGKDVESQVIFVQKSLMDRFRLDLLKEDFNIKSQFLNHFLFCNISPIYSIANINVQKLKKGQIVKGIEDKAFLVFDGSIIQEIFPRNGLSFRKNFGQKWRFQLVRGSLICKSNLKYLLEQGNKLNQTDQFAHTYTLLTDSIFLTIWHSQLMKIVKVQKCLRKMIIQKIEVSQKAHMELIKRSMNVQQELRLSQKNATQFYYSIPRKSKSKAFRRRTQMQLNSNGNNNYEQFITLSKYEKMTQNKENVGRRHLEYQQMRYQLREKEKEERFMKKMKTQKGKKEFKKSQYQARLKQSKIECLAIKDSIVNTQKFRDRPHEVKFIFEEEMVEKYITMQTQKKIESAKKNKKARFVSMVEFPQDKSEGRLSKMELKMQILEQYKRKKGGKDSKFFNRSVKFLRCQSTPDILSSNTLAYKII